MENPELVNKRLQKLNELKLKLNDIDHKLLLLTTEIQWDHNKLLEESVPNMVTCSVNKQHRVPISKLKTHEQKCALLHHGYLDSDKFFSEPCERGSFVTFTPELLHSVTKNVISDRVFLYTGFIFYMMEFKSNHILLPTSTRNVCARLCQSVCDSDNNLIREVPQTSAKLDQNFKREEKLAIYNHVIANTQKQNLTADLWLDTTTKTEEKKEMSAWEIAAAERDAKRRRASYRNKVHTNRKTHTEILREVIESQMEAFKEEKANEKTEEEKMEKPRSDHKKSSHDSRKSPERSRYHESSHRRSKEDRDKRRSHEKYSKHRDHKRSPDTGSDIKFGSRSHDKYRKWKSYEGRSHSHRSSHTHRR